MASARLDLAQRGQTWLLSMMPTASAKARAPICFSKRSLEFWDRLGIGQRHGRQGRGVDVGKIFHGASQLYQFNLCGTRPQAAGLHQPAAVLCRGLSGRPRDELPAIDLRWRNKVTALESRNDTVALTIATPMPYELHAGLCRRLRRRAPSLRQLVGAEFAGQVFEDQFLIADVRMIAEFPTRALVLVRSAFHAGRSALLHKQPDDIWRIDLQLSRDADPAIEAAGECAAAACAHARPRQVRFRVDLALQISVPPHGPLRPWPRDLCRRCRASGLAIRRARRQFGP